MRFRVFQSFSIPHCSTITLPAFCNIALIACISSQAVGTLIVYKYTAVPRFEATFFHHPQHQSWAQPFRPCRDDHFFSLCMLIYLHTLSHLLVSLMKSLTVSFENHPMLDSGQEPTCTSNNSVAAIWSHHSHQHHHHHHTLCARHSQESNILATLLWVVDLPHIDTVFGLWL